MKDYPIIKFAIGLSVGILIQNHFNLSVVTSISISVIVILLIILFYIIKFAFYNSLIKILSLVLFVNIGQIVSEINKQDLSSKLSNFHKENNTVVFGKIELIDLKKKHEVSFTLVTDSLLIKDTVIHTNEKLLCRLRSSSKDRNYFYNNFSPGNFISFKGTFTQPRTIRNPGEFDYKKYLLSKGITGIITSYSDSSAIQINEENSVYSYSIFKVRKYFDSIIQKTHNKQTAGLLRGLLLADRSEIEHETKQNFINAGVIHILAVSGLHVGYILLFFVVVFGRLNIFIRSVLVMIGIFSFMLITEVPASVFRATLMASILIIAFLTNRSTNLLNSIALSSVVILLIQPHQLFNPGFQLSYSAVISIAVIYPLIKNQIDSLWIRNEFIKKILLFIGVSLSAQIGTLPFTVAYFNKISLIALLANLLVIPLTALIVGLGIITLVLGSLSIYVASFMGITNNFLTAIMIKLVNFSGGIEYSHIRINNYSTIDALIFYFFISVFIYGLSRISSIISKIVFTLLIVFNIYLYSQLDNKELLPDGKLNILMIDVDQGDSFLIKFPNGKTALVDAGLATPFFDVGERIIIPLLDNLGIQKIDYGFISHLDNDHYGGFVSLLMQDRIKKVFIQKPDSSSKSVKFNKFLEDLKIPQKIFHREKINFDNVAVYVLNDTTVKYFDKLSSNDRSGIIKIVYGKTSFLFLGDLEYPGENYYCLFEDKMLDADVLKVSHHGSKTGTSEYLLKLITPKISLISAGVKNKFGHPSEIVLERLKNINSQILRTDSAGAVLLQSDGREIKIVDWRKF